jgi:prepilin peptidase CpaA
VPSENITSTSSVLLISLLIVALYTDITEHKIPNVLVLTIVVLGLGYQFFTLGILGLGHALFGIFIGFIIFMPFNIYGGMRGGDLKLMAAVGAFLTLNTAIAAGLTLIAGSLLGILFLLWRKGGKDYYTRYFNMLNELLTQGHWHYQPPADNTAAATSFPYAMAIFTGVTLTLVFFN